MNISNPRLYSQVFRLGALLKDPEQLAPFKIMISGATVSSSGLIDLLCFAMPLAKAFCRVAETNINFIM